MKILWHRVVLIATIFIIGFYWFTFRIDPTNEKFCDEMVEEIQELSRRDSLMAFAMKVAKKHSLDTNFGEVSGPLSHSQIIDKTLYDSNLLDSLASPPTIALVGNDINYNDLSNSEVESVAIGLGWRAFILIDVDKDGIFNGAIPVHGDDDIKAKVGDFMVVCRSNNFND